MTSTPNVFSEPLVHTAVEGISEENFQKRYHDDIGKPQAGPCSMSEDFDIVCDCDAMHL